MNNEPFLHVLMQSYFIKKCLLLFNSLLPKPENEKRFVLHFDLVSHKKAAFIFASKPISCVIIAVMTFYSAAYDGGKLIICLITDQKSPDKQSCLEIDYSEPTKNGA